MSDLQVGGQWDAIQSNGFTAHFDINQDGPIDLGQFGIFGRIGTSIDGGKRCSHSNGTVRSTAATGFVQHDFFQLKVTWDNGTEGMYTGFLRRTGNDQGLITGETRDLLHNSHATWKSNRNFPL